MTSEPSVVEDDVQENLVGQTHPWLIACLVGAALALIFPVVVTWFFVPIYEASALIQIRAKTPFLAFEPEREDILSGEKYVQTQIELLRDPLVLGSVVSQSNIRKLPELAESQDPILDLAEMISVRAVGKSELYGIVLRSANPNAATETVNAVVESYFKVLDNDEAKLRQSTIELLEEESDRRLKNIVRLREQLRKSAKEAGMSGSFLTGGQSSVPTQKPLAVLRERLTVAEVDKEVLEVRIKDQMQEPLRVSQKMIMAEIEANALVKELREQLLRKKLKMIDLEDELNFNQPGNIEAGQIKAVIKYLDEEHRKATFPGLPFLTGRENPPADTEFNSNIPEGLVKPFEYRMPKSPVVPQNMNREEAGASALTKELLTQKESKVSNPKVNEKEKKEREKRDAKAREENKKHLSQIAELAKDINKTERKLSRLCELLTPRITDRLKAKLAFQQEEQLKEIRQRLRESQTAEELLKRHYEVMPRKQQNETGDSMDLTFQMAELTRSEEVLERISRRAIALKTERRAPARVFKRRDARVPEELIVRWPYIQMAVAALVGLFLPLVVAGLLKVKSVMYIR